MWILQEAPRTMARGISMVGFSLTYLILQRLAYQEKNKGAIDKLNHLHFLR